MQGRRNRRLPLSMLQWDRYPIRTCRSLHYCEVCCRDIVIGQPYRDGGYSRRAHVACLDAPNTSSLRGAEKESR
jgi:hypothetical protein